MSYGCAGCGMGQEPPKKLTTGKFLGWSAVVAAAAGVFYLTTTGKGMEVTPNRRRRRRSSRRRTSRAPRRNRRVTRRRTSRMPPKAQELRSYKALSASARRSMPQSSFAVEGKRFPIKGPPGSSRERDKWQAMQAIRFLNMGRVGSRSEYLAVRNAVIRKYGMAFWRSYDGPTWSKVEKAKRKRARTRKRTTRRRATRRLAANPKIVGPVRAYAAANGRRVRPNRRTSKRRSTAKGRAAYAIGQIRRMGVAKTPKAGKLNGYVRARLARKPAGTYRIGGSGRNPTVVKFKSTSLQGQMTNTRIAASKSKEPHWLVKVYASGSPKVVVVRKIDKKGESVYRVEGYAQALRETRRVRRAG